MKKILILAGLISSCCYANQSLANEMKANAIYSVLQKSLEQMYFECIKANYVRSILNKTTALNCEEQLDNFVASFFKEGDDSNPDHRGSIAQKILRNN